MTEIYFSNVSVTDLVLPLNVKFQAMCPVHAVDAVMRYPEDPLVPGRSHKRGYRVRSP